MKSLKTLPRLICGVVCLVGIAGIALIARDERPPVDNMVDAAESLLAGLSPELRKEASFAFDDPHRTGWLFTPQQNKERQATRKGVRFEKLSDDQKKKVLALLRSGTSAKGYEQATSIMGLEGFLRDVEKAGAMVRNPEWYFVSIFGTPSKTGKWGWRFEGHHLSISFTMDNGKIESATPYFFGANPAEYKSGAKKGQRTLPECEDLLRDLVKSLDADQNKTAHQGAKHFPEVAENTPAAKIGEPVGLAAAKMTDAQKAKLLTLLQSYLDRMPAAAAAAEMQNVKQAGIEKIHVAYSGDLTPGKGFTYRVHGPTFVVQFLNIQADGSGNPANHIHSVWRKLPADFALKDVK